MAKLSDQLRELGQQMITVAGAIEVADAGAAAGNRVPGPRPADLWALPLDSSPDRKFMSDFWVVGVPGALAGTLLKHYSEGRQILSMMGGSIPPEQHIFRPVDKALPWTSSVSTPADVGWVDGSGYRADMPGRDAATQAAAYFAAGSPSHNAGGKYGGYGQLVTDPVHTYGGNVGTAPAVDPGPTPVPIGQG